MRRVHVIGRRSAGKTTLISELVDQLRRWGVRVGTRLAPLHADCDLVLVEGDQDARALKVEVWRSGAAEPPMAAARGDIAFVVSDDPIDADVPRLPRWNVPLVADAILGLVHLPASRLATRGPTANACDLPPAFGVATGNRRVPQRPH